MIPAESREGRVVLVATPIGNLGDLSARAAAALADADVIACEDTRRTGRLLRHLELSRPLVRYDDHTEAARTDELVSRARSGEVVAVVTDAGTPGVSDPGYRLVVAAQESGVPVEAVPGPVAAVLALVLSGLPTDRFTFEGFLPRKDGARAERLATVATLPHTLVFYVAPHRAADDLAAMAELLGQDRPAALARELTKLHEEVVRAPLGELARQAAEQPPRGEVTVVVGGAPERSPDAAPDVADLAARVEHLVAAGISRRDAVRRVAASTGVPKSVVYEAAHPPEG